MSEQKLEIHKDCTLNEAVAIAHKVRESYHCTVSLPDRYLSKIDTSLELNT